MLRRMLLVAWAGSHSDMLQAQDLHPQYTVGTLTSPTATSRKTREAGSGVVAKNGSSVILLA